MVYFPIDEEVLRIYQVAQKLKIPSGEIVNFLKLLGYELPRGINQPLQPEMYGAVLYRFRPQEFESYVQNLHHNGDFAQKIKERVDSLPETTDQVTVPPTQPLHFFLLKKESHKEKTIFARKMREPKIRILKEYAGISKALEDLEKKENSKKIWEKLAKTSISISEATQHDLSTQTQLVEAYDKYVAVDQSSETSQKIEHPMEIGEKTPEAEIAIEQFSNAKSRKIRSERRVASSPAPSKLQTPQKEPIITEQRRYEPILTPSLPQIQTQPIKLTLIDLELLRLLLSLSLHSKRLLLREFYGLR